MTRHQIVMSICLSSLALLSGSMIYAYVNTPSHSNSSFKSSGGNMPRWYEHSYSSHKEKKIVQDDGLNKPRDKVVYESGLTIEVLLDDYVANSQESTTSHHELIPDASGSTLD